MLSIWALGVLLLAAAVSQVTIVLVYRGRAVQYCVASQTDADVAAFVTGDNANCGMLYATTSTPSAGSFDD
jgi:hypothetical protein